MEKVSYKEATDTEIDDLESAAKVAMHVKSNAIVIFKNGQTIGIGAGQMSRIDAVELAIKKARDFSHCLSGAFL